MPLLSYETARPWAKAIKEKVLMREMPPWPADPNGSLKFRNEVRLSQQDIHTLVAWVDGGAPKGTDSDLPPMPSPAQGWLHPKGIPPDSVITLTEFKVPAQGELPYVTYLAKVPISEDKWIAAIQVRPGNRAVVHHMAITEIALDEGLTPADLGPLARLARQIGSANDLIGTRHAVTAFGNPQVFDMLGVYTPGTTFEMYADGSAKLLKGGRNFYLNFNIHYQTTGKPETDRSMIAFWFQPRPPKRQLFRVNGAGKTIIVDGKELLTDAPGQKAEGTSAAIPPIPPYADNYEVTGMTAYTQPVTIYQLQPHAHLRGKDFKYTVVYADGREETVLSVPKYDFRWQLAYELETPLDLPVGSKLVVTAHYDNSVNNKYNPGPEKPVFFREGQNQSWDEMFTPFIQYGINSQDLTDSAKTANPQRWQKADTPGAVQAEELRKHDELDIVEVGGCFEKSSPGTWIVTHASDPVVSEAQATSSLALKVAEARPLGSRHYQLLGLSAFNPARYKGQRVAAKGALIKDNSGSRLNVTSLQMLSNTCVK
ncbi:MAG TPA: hypothetical protein VEW69_10545 [Alphaproteobacteria bacterium]|nr:hypothetical protein [Alphaproteobacteria bacterium]